MEKTQFIAGAWRDGQGETVLQTADPATGAVTDAYPAVSEADLADAVTTSVEGFHIWSSTPAWTRSAVLARIGDLVRERQAAIAEAITREQGKPLAESIAEVERAADFFTWGGGEAPRIYDRGIASRDGSVQIARKVPIGPICAFTPWNYPVVLIAKKLSAALAAGCSCILKPSEETPTAPALLVQACLDAGVPAETLNLVFGEPAVISRYLIAMPQIRKVTFTGSVAVGKLLAGQAAKKMKPITMELGGHAPVIVMPDVDVDGVASLVAEKKFHNAGQACISPSRIFVHDDIKDDFRDALAAKAESLRVGPGLAEDTQMGPLASLRRRNAVAGLVQDACDLGADLAAGGERAEGDGFFYQPTILDAVPDDAKVMTEEPFGPVAAISSFADLDDVLARANGLTYGLAAYGFSSSPPTQKRLADGLEAGLVGINMLPGHLPELPLGGWKESGIGVEGGLEAVDSYLINKLQCVQAEPPA